MGFTLDVDSGALPSIGGVPVAPETRGARRRDGVTPVGDQLRGERERRGQTLAQVSDATRIKEVYLDALEHHAWMALPADVFTRGYLRAYAHYLGLNEEHLLQAYARERRIAGGDSAATGSEEPDAARAFLERLAKTRGVDSRRSGSRLKWIALGGMGVAALAAWIFFHPLRPARDASTAMAVPSPTARTPVPAPPPTEVVAGVGTPSMLDSTPQPQPPQPSEQRSAHTLRIVEFGVGKAVRDHRLVGPGERFREGSTVWFWTSVRGGQPGDKIHHVWLHEGRPIGVVELNVDGSEWRTQSHRSLPAGASGQWTVEARDGGGRVIAAMDFSCVAD